MSREPLIPKHGGYRRLRSFQLAQLVYDVTVRFCDRCVDKRSRTHDQMVQAARSSVQNIAEGSQASGTSKKMELKLTNVARASLEELRLDYEDFLRQRGLSPWPAGDPRRTELVARRCRSAEEVAAWTGQVQRRSGRDGLDGHDGQNGRHGQEPPGPSIQSIASIQSMPPMASTEPKASTPPSPGLRLGPTRHATLEAEIAANAALVLIGVTAALLGRQIAAQAAAFEREGGFTERLYRSRVTGRQGL